MSLSNFTEQSFTRLHWNKALLQDKTSRVTCNIQSESFNSAQYSYEQCAQICQIFAALAKSKKFLAIFWEVILYLAYLWTHFGKFGLQLGKLS